MSKRKKTIVKLVIILSLVLVLFAAAFLIINAVVISEAAPYVFGIEDIDSIDKADCVIVPGALVYGDDRLSMVLRDRVDYAISLYNAGKAGKLLFSGDHGRTNYDEVNAMMDYAIKKGVPKEDIFLDHAGFSTYESMYRARDVFQVKSCIIVTQKFHVSRAVYIARALGLDAVGVNSDPRAYSNATRDAIRESLARVKDFFSVILLPEPKYLGDAIPIFGDSGLTHDKN
jgi:vancomycin permeability regulator SanA